MSTRSPLLPALLLLTLVLAPAARAQAPDSSATPPDTGWVEIGGPADFGEDDPFKDLPSAEDEGPVQPLSHQDALGGAVGASSRGRQHR